MKKGESHDVGNYNQEGRTCDELWHTDDDEMGWTSSEWVLGDPILRGDDSNIINIGDRVLIPFKGSLKEAVKLRNYERISLLLLRDTSLGVQSSTNPDI
jgi:hypothetical protein